MAGKGVFKGYRVEGETSCEVVIKNLDSNEKVEIKNYESEDIRPAGVRGYGAIPKSKDLGTKRFQVNSIVYTALGMEDEDRARLQKLLDEELSKRQADLTAIAKRDGFDKGFEAGRAESLEKSEKELAPKFERMTELIVEFEKAREAIFQANEKLLIDLVFRIAKQILLKDINLDPGLVGRMAAEIIERLGVRENIKLKVSVEERDLLKNLESELKKTLGDLKNLSIEASTSVRPGGCIVETDLNVADANIDTHLEKIYEALVGAAKKSNPTESSAAT